MANPQAAPSSLDNILNLLGSTKGQTTTQTTSSGINQEGMMAIINQILSGNQGLASIAQGEKAAGGYNSTSRQLLTNDLLTQAAATAQAKGTGQTTTTKTSPKVDSGTLVGTLALAAGKSLLGPTISAIGKKYGLDSDTLGKVVQKSILGNTDKDSDTIFQGTSPFSSADAGGLATVSNVPGGDMAQGLGTGDFDYSSANSILGNASNFLDSTGTDASTVALQGLGEQIMSPSDAATTISNYTDLSDLSSWF